MNIVLQHIVNNISHINHDHVNSVDGCSLLSKFISGMKPSFNDFVRYIKEIKVAAEKQNSALKELNKDFHNRIKQREVQQEELRTEQQHQTVNIDGKSDGIKTSDNSTTSTSGGLLGTFSSILGLLGLVSGDLSMTSFISALGRFFVGHVLRIGAFILTKMNPVGWIASIAAAIGYGIYKYFTDDEFKKTIDDGLKSIKTFVMEDIFQPLVEKMSSIISGTIDFLSQLWESVTKFAGKAYDYVSDKIGDAKDVVVGAIKDTSAAVSTFATKWVENAPANAGISSPMFIGSQIGDSLTNSLNTSSAYFNTPSKHNYENNYRNNDEVVPSNDTGVATPLNDYGNAFAPIPTLESVDASKLSQVANIKGGVDVEHLAPALKVRLAGMATEFVQKTGRKLTINSGYRSSTKQAELYRRDPQHAAKPGKSAHEVGAAIDINTTDINAAEQLGLLRKYKLFRPLYPPFKLSGILESWHVEPLERTGILSYGDGGIVVNNDGAINPSDGSIVPPTRDDGATIGASSAQVNQKEEDATVTQNIIINAQRNYVENYQLSPVIVSSGNKNKNFISPLAR